MNTFKQVVDVMSHEQARSLKAVLDERICQQDRWGHQTHDLPTFLAILTEEVGELAEEVLNHKFHDAPIMGNLYTEAVQVAAVALQIIERLDQMATEEAHQKEADMKDEDLGDYRL